MCVGCVTKNTRLVYAIWSGWPAVLLQTENNNNVDECAVDGL